MVYANYALVDATIQTNVQLPAPNNPNAVPCNDAPEYWFTPRIRGGADLVVASNQIFFNDWANTNAPLAGYATVNIHGSYDVTDHVQLYG